MHWNILTIYCNTSYVDVISLKTSYWGHLGGHHSDVLSGNKASLCLHFNASTQVGIPPFSRDSL